LRRSSGPIPAQRRIAGVVQALHPLLRHLVPGGGRTGNRRRFRNRGSLRRRNPLEAPGGTLRRQQRRVEAGEGDRSPENEIPPFPLQNRRLRQRQGLVRQKSGTENGRRQKSGRPMVRRRLGDPELVMGSSNARGRRGYPPPSYDAYRFGKRWMARGSSRSRPFLRQGCEPFSERRIPVNSAPLPSHPLLQRLIRSEERRVGKERRS